MEIDKRKQMRLKEYDYSAYGAYFVTICIEKHRNILSVINKQDSYIIPQIKLLPIGNIANDTFRQVEKIYDVEFDYKIIMPNHIHFIVFIKNNRATARVAPTVGDEECIQNVCGECMRATARVAPTVGDKGVENECGEYIRATARVAPTVGDKGVEMSLGADCRGDLHGRPITLGQVVGAYKSLVVQEAIKIFNAENETLGKLWQRNYYEHIIRNDNDLYEVRKYIKENPLRWRNKEIRKY